MGNREEHISLGMAIGAPIIIGMLVGFADSFAAGLWQALLGLFLLAVGSVLPDWLEPPTHWNHRQENHSKETLYGTGIFSAVSIVLVILHDSAWIILFGLLFGYSLHLLLDSTTKMGLPDE
ncbi:MAG: hypothetical protein GPJ51_13905 [Candidatus Heimdallarchaeota archaeon]|nr:hypothetical protein [Candidatus Heimdallarchaeota archaeon]